MNDSERLAGFVDIAEQVREAQKRYFRTHDGLDECKKLERALDRLITEYRNEQSGQKKMF